MSTKIQKIPRSLLACLRSDSDKLWEEKELIHAAMPGTGYTNYVRFKNCLIFLGASNVVSYKTRTRGGEYYDIQLVPQTEDVQVELDKAKEQIRQLVEESTARRDSDRVVEVVLKDAKGKEVKKTEGLFHGKFETLLSLASARMNIFLYGPTGCGKSHTVEQLANALNLPFSFISCTAGMSEGQIGGRSIPTMPDLNNVVEHYRGLVKKKISAQEAAVMASSMSNGFSYVISEFVHAYENGGVFLLDEIDAADSNVLLLINAALANGHMAIPNRPHQPYAKRHKDFICVAAANTVGTGSDRLYSGRNRLDAATLDRFQIGKVMMDYDERVERQLCPDVELYNHLMEYRKNIRNSNLERAVSSRFMKDAHKMKTEFKWKHEQIDEAFFSGWKESEIRKVRGY